MGGKSPRSCIYFHSKTVNIDSIESVQGEVCIVMIQYNIDVDGSRCRCFFFFLRDVRMGKKVDRQT